LGMPVPDDTDATNQRSALRAIARGDQTAIERLYDQYSPSVMALAMRMLANREQAEELVTDVFMELWNRCERFDPARCRLAAHLLALCRERAIDRVRTRQCAKPALRDQPDTHTPRDPSSLFAQLAPEQRAVLELAYFEAAPPAQIAARLGQPLETITLRLRHGLIQLRDRHRAARNDTGSAGATQGQAS
jgi:RNA polymerase sigma-70 factor (ECF subfamily)